MLAKRERPPRPGRPRCCPPPPHGGRLGRLVVEQLLDRAQFQRRLVGSVHRVHPSQCSFSSAFTSSSSHIANLRQATHSQTSASGATSASFAQPSQTPSS